MGRIVDYSYQRREPIWRKLRFYVIVVSIVAILYWTVFASLAVISVGAANPDAIAMSREKHAVLLCLWAIVEFPMLRVAKTALFASKLREYDIDPEGWVVVAFNGLAWGFAAGMIIDSVRRFTGGLRK